MITPGGNKIMPNLNEMIKQIESGLLSQSAGARGGCGRAYVCLSTTESKETLSLFRKAMEACGLRYLDRAYGVGRRAAYIGYDNADGLALAQAEQIARNLRSLGIDCYDDAASD